MNPESLLNLLRRHGLTIAFCESLTAGLASATLADAPGASAVLRGGLVTYATEVKAHFLGEQQVRDHGVISEATALAMAEAAQRECGSRLGVGLTGVAGPTKQEGREPGIVCLAVSAGPQARRSVTVHLGDRGRNAIRRATVGAAFGLVAEVVEEIVPENGTKSVEGSL